MPHDSSTHYGITCPLDDKDIQKLHHSAGFKRAKVCFWPLVFGITIVFGLFDGIKGAFVGFLYGTAAGLFLLHESLRRDKK
jgi:hypothetical protein